MLFSNCTQATEGLEPGFYNADNIIDVNVNVNYARFRPQRAQTGPPFHEFSLRPSSRFNANDLPVPGGSIEVAPGILWIRMPLPFALDHINLWLLEDSEETATGVRKGWTAVDCGVTNPGTQAAWEQVFAGPMKGLPILRVLVTHMHPDHMGLAHWLCDTFKAPLLISATEYQSATMASNGTSNFGGVGTQEFFSANGWTDPEDQAMVKERVFYYNMCFWLH